MLHTDDLVVEMLQLVGKVEHTHVRVNFREYALMCFKAFFEEPPEDDNAATKPKKIPPCGMSFNWNQNDGLEVLVGSRGIKHGKKPKTPQDIEKLASRLCRARLIKDFLSLKEEGLELNPVQNATPSPESEYFQIKTDAAKSEWSNLKNRILTQNGSPLAGWLRCIKVEDSGP